MKTQYMTIYSLRFSYYGWLAYPEKVCETECAPFFLDVLQSNEPSVHFLVSRKKPTVKQIAAIVETM